MVFLELQHLGAYLRETARPLRPCQFFTTHSLCGLTEQSGTAFPLRRTGGERC